MTHEITLSTHSVNKLQTVASDFYVDATQFQPLPLEEGRHAATKRELPAHMFKSTLLLAGTQDLDPATMILARHAGSFLDSYYADELGANITASGLIEAHSTPEFPTQEGVVNRAEMLRQIPALGSLPILRSVWPFSRSAIEQAEQIRMTNLTILDDAGYDVRPLGEQISRTALPSTAIDGIATRYDKFIDAEVIAEDDRRMYVMTQQSHIVVHTEEGLVKVPGALSQSLITPRMRQRQRVSDIIDL